MSSRRICELERRARWLCHSTRGNTEQSNIHTTPGFSFGYENQSGQTYKGRPPWNVAGVDYPVGIPEKIVLKDLAIAPLPSGCIYSANGNSVGGPIIKCSAAGRDLTFDGFDFSGKLAGSHGCVDFSPGLRSRNQSHSRIVILA